MFRASLCPCSGALDCTLLHMGFSTRCAVWCLGEQRSRPCALCRGCYSSGLTCHYILRTHGHTKIKLYTAVCQCTPVVMYEQQCGPGSSVGIVTDYGLDGPGSNPGGSEIFRTCPDRPWGPPSLLYNVYRVFLGAKVRPWRDADPLTPSSAVVKEE